MITIKKATVKDVDKLLPLLFELDSINQTQKEWQSLFKFQWDDQNYCGYVMYDGGKAVGFLGLLFSRRVVNDKPNKFCNITSWIVRKEYRRQSLHLLLPVLELDNHTITVLTCNAGTYFITKKLGFIDLEIGQRVILPLPFLPKSTPSINIIFDHSEIEKLLKEETLKKGYPQTFRQSWAKNSSEKIIPIAKELQQAGLLTGVGIALETLDEETLKIIKRKNIDFDTLSELTDSFDSVNLPTYTEIIRGLPGESLQSFKDGLEILVSDTKIDSIYIYNCSVLPNAPLNEYDYRKKYEIEMIRSPIFLAHSSIHRRGIDEYEYIVTSSNSFTLEDLKEMFLFSWLIITFHNLGIFEYISKYYHQEKKLSFLGFYEIFLNFCRNKKSIFSDEYNLVNKYIDDGYSGKGWDYYDSDLGEIYWPIEEATWLHLMSNTKKLTSSIRSFMNYLENNFGYATDSNILDDLSKFQVFLLSTKDIKYITKTQTFFFDWKNYFVNEKKLKQDKKVYTYSNMVVERNDFDWNKKAIWYGRRSQKFKFNPKNL